MFSHVIESFLEYLIVLPLLIIVCKTKFDSIDETWQVVELEGLHHHLQKGYQILVEVPLKDAETRFHDLDGKLNYLIEIHELLDNVWDKDPNLLEQFDIRVLLTLREFLTLLEEVTDQEQVALDLT